MSSGDVLDGISGGSLVWRLRRYLFGDRPDGFLYECRRCGHSISKKRGNCPECGAADIARYEL